MKTRRRCRRASKARDAELLSKPVHEPSPVPRPKMKMAPSPRLAVSQDRQVTAPTSGLMHKSNTKASGSTKCRRSPIYTSEDEGGIPQPRKRSASLLPPSGCSISSDQLPSDRASYQRTMRGHPPASDHDVLCTLHTTYLGAFSKVIVQRRKIEAMLNGDSEELGQVEYATQDAQERGWGLPRTDSNAVILCQRWRGRGPEHQTRTYSGRGWLQQR